MNCKHQPICVINTQLVTQQQSFHFLSKINKVIYHPFDRLADETWLIAVGVESKFVPNSSSINSYKKETITLNLKAINLLNIYDDQMGGKKVANQWLVKSSTKSFLFIHNQSQNESQELDHKSMN